MPSFSDVLMLALIVAVFPIGGAVRAWQRRRSGQLEPPSRPRLYHRAVQTQWSVAVVVLVQWAVSRRPWTALGVVPRLDRAHLATTLWIAAVGALLLFARARVMRRPDVVARMRVRLGRTWALLPRTASEERAFVPLALTAGVCEELVFRGFVTWIFTAMFGLEVGVAAAALLFGLSHAHLGLGGMMLTALIGAWFGLVAIATGSLLPGMVLHALIDLQAGRQSVAAFAGDVQPPTVAGAVDAGPAS